MEPVMGTVIEFVTGTKIDFLKYIFFMYGLIIYSCAAAWLLIWLPMRWGKRRYIKKTQRKNHQNLYKDVYKIVIKVNQNFLNFCINNFGNGEDFLGAIQKELEYFNEHDIRTFKDLYVEIENIYNCIFGKDATFISEDCEKRKKVLMHLMTPMKYGVIRDNFIDILSTLKELCLADGWHEDNDYDLVKIHHNKCLLITKSQEAIWSALFKIDDEEDGEITKITKLL